MRGASALSSWSRVHLKRIVQCDCAAACSSCNSFARLPTRRRDKTHCIGHLRLYQTAVPESVRLHSPAPQVSHHHLRRLNNLRTTRPDMTESEPTTASQDTATRLSVDVEGSADSPTSPAATTEHEADAADLETETRQPLADESNVSHSSTALNGPGSSPRQSPVGSMALELAQLMLETLLPTSPTSGSLDPIMDSQDQDPPPPYSARDELQGPPNSPATVNGTPTDIPATPDQHRQQIPNPATRPQLIKEVVQRLMAIDHVLGKLRGVNSWTYWHLGFCCGLFDGETPRLALRQAQYITNHLSGANDGTDLTVAVKDLLETYGHAPPAPPITVTSLMSFAKCEELLNDTAGMLDTLVPGKGEILRKHTSVAKGLYFHTLLTQLDEQFERGINNLSAAMGL
ncbi:hypothetical protein EJ03DRAFT_57217 [Teratosphaeria nubilosa]|uniref:Uncharacterized protein n=1 Tax=Teratosphaeria nubilosa TaxID=161662 RepID=A0A6G1KUH4_9PEZI|nr:hypothetical protein EJ03DRAFT_57217 [Teratosphaeria nubilosa]